MKRLLGGLLLAFLLPTGIQAATINGTVTKQGGNSAIVEARVILRMGNQSIDTAMTNETGEFGFTELAVGNYTVAVSKEGFVSSNNFSNIANADTTVTLAIGLAPTPNPGTVSGVVKKLPDSSVVEGATIILRRTTGGGGGAVAFADTVTTDEEGKYSFTEVPSASGYTLLAQAAGLDTLTRANVRVGSDSTTTADFVLAPAGTPGSVSGTVMKSSDSSGLAGAMVVLRRTTGGGGGATVVFSDTALSDDEGKFSFGEVPVASGYSLIVSAEGYVSRTVNNVNSTAAVDTKVNVYLDPPAAPGKLEGVVLALPDSSAAQGVTVILRRTTGGGAGTVVFADTATTDEDGKFAFESVPASNGYSLVASKTGYTTRTQNNVTVRSDSTTTVNLTIAPPTKGTLVVYVGVDSTSPLSGAALTAISGGNEAQGETDDEGYATFEDVLTGNYTVTALADGYVVKAGTRVVSENGMDTLMIFLVEVSDSNTKALTGVVRDNDSAAIAGVKVVFRSGGGGSAITLETTTDENGEYGFGRIAASVNNGTLTLSKDGYATQTVNNVSMAASTNTRDVVLNKASAIWSRLSQRAGLRQTRLKPGVFVLPSGTRLDAMGRMNFSR